MACIAASLALTSTLAASAILPSSVRIGLVSLFKPELIQVQVSGGGRAELRAGGLQTVLAPEEVLTLKLQGARVRVTHLNRHGRVSKADTAARVRVTPLDSNDLVIVLPGKLERRVRGDLEIQPQRGRLQIVLTASLESAVASVVAAEMSAGSGVEAVKSLAIVVRTFMASHSGRHAAARFDFCDTTHCQLYRGEDDLADRSTRARVGAAVEATEGQYLSFRHRPIEGHYTAACGGLSATPDLVWGGSSASGYPYRPVACEWCRTSRFYRWERSAPAELVLDALSVGTGLGISPAAELSTRSYEPSGPVREVVIINRGHRVTISPDQFRRYVGRKLGWNTVLSPTFTIERRGPVFVFRGQGFGSQVGLCVAGAAAQASAGRTHKDILSFHFPDAEITSHIAQ